MSSGSKIQAAFFDLDKTIIAKSSVLAYSKTFRNHGLLNRRSLAKAAYGQVIFQVLGANESKMEKMRQVALELTKGWNHDHVKELVQESLQDVVVPIIYEDAVELIEYHKEQGRMVIIVSSAPAEIVEPMAIHLGADEYIATETKLDAHGNYTGELDFYAYGIYKPQAMKTMSEKLNIDLENSYAYSDSVTDIPLLECVGKPVVVNPDRELSRYARQRGWRIEKFSHPVTMWDRLPVRFFSSRNFQIALGTAVTFGLGALALSYGLKRRR